MSNEVNVHISAHARRRMKERIGKVPKGFTSWEEFVNAIRNSEGNDLNHMTDDEYEWYLKNIYKTPRRGKIKSRPIPFCYQGNYFLFNGSKDTLITVISRESKIIYR